MNILRAEIYLCGALMYEMTPPNGQLISDDYKFGK